MPKQWVTSRRYCDNRVENPSGQPLGRIKEIVLDKATGKAAYVVITRGGFLGLGAKLFAVAWDELKPCFEDRRVIWDMDQESLDASDGLDRAQWPDAPDKAMASGRRTMRN